MSKDQMISLIIYVVAFLLFFSLIFKILTSTRLDEAFKKGRVSEIRLAYILISIICSYLLCEFINRLLSFYGFSL